MQGEIFLVTHINIIVLTMDKIEYLNSCSRSHHKNKTAWNKL